MLIREENCRFPRPCAAQGRRSDQFIELESAERVLARFGGRWLPRGEERQRLAKRSELPHNRVKWAENTDLGPLVGNRRLITVELEIGR